MLRTADYSRPEAVIIDFGIAQPAVEDRGLNIGTPGYMPPEVWSAQMWLLEGDIFSMGVVVMQMLLQNVPEHHRKLHPNEPMKGVFLEQCNSVAEVAHATKFREAPFNLLPMAGVAHICQAMLQKDWRKRPSAERVLQDSWFDASVLIPRLQCLRRGVDAALGTADIHIAPRAELPKTMLASSRSVKTVGPAKFAIAPPGPHGPTGGAACRPAARKERNERKSKVGYPAQVQGHARDLVCY